MILIQILTERRIILQKAVTELQNSEQNIVCCLGNYWVDLRNQQDYEEARHTEQGQRYY
jgi:hypothetical protein